MRRVTQREKDVANHTLEKNRSAAAEQSRTDSGHTSAQFPAPALGLIFLRFAEARFAHRRTQLEKGGASSRRGASHIEVSPNMFYTVTPR